MRLLLARVGAGKTTAVQEHLLDLKRRQPLAKVWVLLSTQRQIADFRGRFVRGVSFNVEYFNFYSLYHHILTLAGKPQRRLDDAARLGLIRALLAEHYRREPGVFARIAHTPGFVSIMGTFLYELKQNLIAPEDFAAAARSPKQRELAQLYAEYQNALRDHDLVDDEGEGWLALEALQQQPEIVRAVDLLIVDGYDQFNALQAALLAALGARIDNALVTLTTIPGREATIGRRFQQALERLQAAHAAHSLPLEISSLNAPADERHPALRHLSEQLLRPRPQPAAADSALQWIEAPDPAREVGAVLRRVKRLLLDGSAPDDILIALRDWARYGGQVAAQGRVYDLPLALHYGDPLAHSPVVVALLDLLGLHAGDFRRRDLLDALRSPYFDVLSVPQVDLLERISREMRITGGRVAWLEAIDLAAQSADATEDNPSPLVVHPESAQRLSNVLGWFFDRVTPPQRASLEQYAAWVDDLIGHDNPDAEADPTSDDSLSMIPRIHESDVSNGADEALVSRDLAALAQFKRGLRGLVAAQSLASALGYPAQTDWATFFRELRTLVDSTTVERGGSREGRVLVTTVADARGLPHRHIFILGLSEGIFPQPTPEDPLLLDGERASLNIGLPTQAERAGDDGLFYSLIGQARDSLIFSRPHSNNGEPWAASHLWKASLAVFSGARVGHLRLGDVPADPATRQEAALAAAERLTSGAPLGWVDPEYWARVRLGREIEIRRLSRDPHDHYTGRLRDPALIAAVAAFLDSNHVWSASQLNDYGLCGFRFFSSRLLGLEALEEPEDGMDSLQLGTLYHEILEQTYRRLGGVITPDRVDEALSMLEQVARERMASAPDRLRFRVSALWQQDQQILLRRLRRLVRDDFLGGSPLDKKFGGQREIYRQEARFDDFALDLDGGESLRLRGSIDRMDRQGERVIVVDYKSGSADYKAEEIEQGRNFQMLVYLLAAQALISQDDAPDAPREVAGGLFWRIGNSSADLIPMDGELIAAGLEHLRRYLSLARSGDFAAHAGRLDAGKCARYCDFHKFCRVANVHQRKAEHGTE